jgi:hypothetical protein
MLKICDYIPASHYVKRLTWLYEKNKCKVADPTEQSKFLERMHQIDSGLPISRQFVEESTRLFPRLIDIPRSLESSKDQCPICRETHTDPIQLVECKHEFCYKCLDAWSEVVHSKFLCPLCRQEPTHFVRLKSPPLLCGTMGLSYTNPVVESVIEHCLVTNTRTLLVTDCVKTLQTFQNHPFVSGTSWTKLNFENQDKYHKIIFLDSPDPWVLVETFQRFSNIPTRICLVTRYSMQHYLMCLITSTPNDDFLFGYASFLVDQLSE